MRVSAPNRLRRDPSPASSMSTSMSETQSMEDFMPLGWRSTDSVGERSVSNSRYANSNLSNPVGFAEAGFGYGYEGQHKTASSIRISPAGSPAPSEAYSWVESIASFQANPQNNERIDNEYHGRWLNGDGTTGEGGFYGGDNTDTYRSESRSRSEPRLQYEYGFEPQKQYWDQNASLYDFYTNAAPIVDVPPPHVGYQSSNLAFEGRLDEYNEEFRDTATWDKFWGSSQSPTKVNLRVVDYGRSRPYAHSGK